MKTNEMLSRIDHAKNQDEYIIKNLEEILPAAFTNVDLNRQIIEFWR